jgi:hypothetical protein
MSALELPMRAYDRVAGRDVPGGLKVFVQDLTNPESNLRRGAQHPTRDRLVPSGLTVILNISCSK